MLRRSFLKAVAAAVCVPLAKPLAALASRGHTEVVVDTIEYTGSSPYWGNSFMGTPRPLTEADLNKAYSNFHIGYVTMEELSAPKEIIRGTADEAASAELNVFYGFA